uniref:LysR_substrate domain-containing protein n=1 Tax=Caenorhabditis tropicalis TaxID=1561998 RepID=A0A1I7UEA4_9PELO
MTFLKTYPEIIDLTAVGEDSSIVLDGLLTGNRRFTASVPLKTAAEILHVATELKLVNLIRIMEKDLVEQPPKSMKQSVDSLNLSLEFELKEAVEKLVNEIVFEFLNEEFLLYCKNSKALEMVFNRKNELVGQETLLAPLQAPPPPPSQGQLVPRIPQNPFIPKEMFIAAKQKFRIIMNRPMNSVKNGFAWVHAKRRQRERNDGFEEFLDFEHF